MLLINIRHSWIEADNEIISFPHGREETSILFFHSPVLLTINNNIYKTTGNSFIIISPSSPFAYHSPSSYSYDFLYVVGNVNNLMQLYNLQPNHLYYPKQNGEIKEIYEQLEYEFYLRPSWWYRYVDIKIEELFIIVSQYSLIEKNTPIDIDILHRLKGMHEEMEIYPERNWSIKNMASRIGISESRLFVVYKSVYNSTPTHEIIKFRTEKAKQLLEQGLNVNLVSERMGYNSVYHFIRQFKQIAGITPKQYISRRK